MTHEVSKSNGDRDLEVAVKVAAQKLGCRESKFKGLQAELGRLKGVAVGLSNKVLNCDIKMGADEPRHEIMIYFPKGMPIECVDYIKPLGDHERGLLSTTILP